MLQELALRTGAQPWAIASMLFFIAVFVAIAYRVFRTPRDADRAHARLPLDDTPDSEGNRLASGLPDDLVRAATPVTETGASPTARAPRRTDRGAV